MDKTKSVVISVHGGTVSIRSKTAVIARYFPKVSTVYDQVKILPFTVRVTLSSNCLPSTSVTLHVNMASLSPVNFSSGLMLHDQP